MKHLYLLRGLPGSGRTTLAAQLQEKEGGFIFSNDDLLGKCERTTLNNLAANGLTQQRVLRAMREEVNPIIVDNPNILLQHIAPYICLAKRYSYEYKIIEMDTEWALDVQELAKKTHHGTSEHDIQRQKEQLLELPKANLEALDLIMDPEETIREVQQALELAVQSPSPGQANNHYERAERYSKLYGEWRKSGGFEPAGASGILIGLHEELRSWRDKT